MGEIILGGELVHCDAEVKTWEEHGMSFVGKRNTFRRKVDPNLVLWHWTGGDNSATTMYHTLLNRNLGVTFCIDINGVIWQFVDPVIWDPQDTTGAVGDRAISIEGMNYGFRMPGQAIPRRGRDRIVDEIELHGTTIRAARFWPDQIHAFATLTKAVSTTLDIPMQFPREEDGEMALRMLTPAEMQATTGIAAHFHKTDQKFDCGFHLLHELESLEAP